MASNRSPPTHTTNAQWRPPLPVPTALSTRSVSMSSTEAIHFIRCTRVYSYEELLRTIARIAGLRPVLVRMPFALWDALAGLAEMMPQPPLTRNQVELMQIDTTASENLPGFRALGISPRSLEDELEAILGRSK